MGRLARIFQVTFSFFLLANFNSFSATEVIIKGENISYAGDELIFYTYTDFITFTEKEIVRCKVNSEGKFEGSFFTNKTLRIHTYLGIYKGYVYVVPETILEIKLPDKQEKTPQQLLNPYFKETELLLGLTNTNKKEINFKIQHFDNLFSEYFYQPVINTESLVFKDSTYKKEIERRLDDGTFVLSADHYMNNYLLSENTNLDSIILEIDKKYEEYKNDFFTVYKKYRLALLKYSSTHYKSRAISNTYFLNQKLYYDNPAFMELFNKVYNKYFLFFGRTKSGEKIYEDIGTYKSITRLKKTLGQDDVLTNDTLKEFVILKGLHDGFYTADFSRSALLQVLDSLHMQTKILEHKEIALFIREKVTKLLQGYIPPEFELYNRDSVLVSLNSFKDKYVYLNFCLCMSYACLKEFVILNNLNKKHSDKLEIVTVLADKDFNKSLNLFKKEGYNWTVLHYGNNPEILKDYDIRAFPTYYLIGPDGKLRLSPAPPPAENLEMRLFQIMRADRYL